MNEKFAIDLIAEEPPIEIHGRHVWCDGGEVDIEFNYLQMLLKLFWICSIFSFKAEIEFKL